MNQNGDKIYKTIEQIPKESEIPNLQEKKKKRVSIKHGSNPKETVDKT